MKKYFWPTLKFSLPIIFSRSGAQLLTMLNVGLIGHFGAKELAQFSVASSPYFTYLLIVLCLTSALPISVAKNKKSQNGLQNTLVTSLLHWIFLSASFVLICVVFAFYFNRFTINSELNLIFLILAGSAPWFVGSFILGSILEALGRAKTHALVTFMALPINFGLSWLAIYFLSAKMGNVEACILGMGATRFLMVLGLFLSLKKQKEISINIEVLNRLNLQISFGQLKSDLLFGAPIAFAYGLRSVGTTLLILSLSHLGVEDIASFSIAMQILMLSTLISRGVASTSIIKVSEFIQKKLFSEIHNLVFSSLSVGLVLVGGLSLGFYLFSHPLFGLFTKNSEIISTLQMSFGIITIIGITDCASGIISGALRPLGDTWIPQVAFGISIIAVAMIVLFNSTLNLRDIFISLALTQSIALAIILFRWRKQRQINLI